MTFLNARRIFPVREWERIEKKVMERYCCENTGGGTLIMGPIRFPRVGLSVSTEDLCICIYSDHTNTQFRHVQNLTWLQTFQTLTTA
jgi:hypothetical protein